jgi:hypothetical protein
LPLLKHLSFSIYYTDKDGEEDSLDLTCKDEYEYDFWFAAIKALIFYHQSKNINKLELLDHSRIFK